MNRMVDLSADDFPGTDRFIIERKLGSGGFGVVYQAYDQERKISVALKVLNRKRSQENARAIYRFKQEFRALTDITHRNLVLLYELISDGDRWFFTMELVNGVNFLDYIDIQQEKIEDAIVNPGNNLSTASINSNTDESITVDTNVKVESQISPTIYAKPILISANKIDRLRRVFLQLVTGLCVLHEAGKLHRDIKPSNVMVTVDERVVILDFGLVTELTNKNDLTDESIVGTPTHMSPEQSMGLPVTPASDWYSVGVMLYQALTGRLPFGGTMHDILTCKLSIDPTPPDQIIPELPADLSQLCLKLLQRNAILRPTGKELLNYLGATETELSILSPISVSQPNRLVGREKPLLMLQQALEQVKEHGPIAVCLQGYSGMGKSSLINHFLKQAQSDCENIILSGRCYEREAVPYKAFDSLIDELSYYLKNLPETAAAELMPPDIQALAKLFPVLRQVKVVTRGQREVLDIVDSQELRRRAFGALREILKRMAVNKRLVLFIDDLQWGDVDSISLLSELLYPPNPPAMLLLISYRSEEVNNRLLQSLLTMLSNCVELRCLLISELNSTEAKDLALSLLGNKDSIDQAELIARESGGNPFFIEALVKYLQTDEQLLRVVIDGENSDKPTLTLTRVIQLRVSKLPEAARRLLEVVAIAGKPIAWALARSAARLTLDPHTTLALLRANHFIRTHGIGEQDEIESYHDRIRETVVAELPSTQLKDHHHHLALLYETQVDADPELLALHFREAGQSIKATDYTIKAADKAAQALAFDRAAALYQLALDQPDLLKADRERLSLKLGEALINAGRGTQAAEVYLMVSEPADLLDKLDFQRRAAEQLLRNGHIDRGIEVLNRLLTAAGFKLIDTPQQALTTIILKRTQLWWRGFNFTERAESQIPREQLLQIDISYSVSRAIGIVNPIRGAAFQAYNIQLALDAGEPYRIFLALINEVIYSSSNGSRAEQQTNKLLADAEALAQRLNRPYCSGMINFAKGIALSLQGRFRAAKVLCEQSIVFFRDHCTGEFWDISNSLIFMLRMKFMLGEFVGLAERISIMIKDAQDRGDLYGEINLRTRANYYCYLVNDEPELAIQELEQSIARWSVQTFMGQHYFAFIGRVESLLYQGDAQAAYDYLNQQWPVVKSTLFMRVQYVLIESLYLRARAALALAVTSVDSRATLLTVASRDAAAILKEPSIWGNALARAIKAAIKAIEGNSAQAEQELMAVENEFMAADMNIYAAAARRQRGQLIGGAAGQSLIADADSSLLMAQVKNPAGITAMLLPGFDRKC